MTLLPNKRVPSWCVALLLSCLGCASPPLPPGGTAPTHKEEIPPSATTPASVAVELRRWIPGDLHCHVSPPDDPDDVSLNVRELGALAQERGLEFLILTPHLWLKSWTRRPERLRFLKKFSTFSEEARAFEGLTLIPGVEAGKGSLGHFGISGVDFQTLAERPDLLEAASEAGAFLVLNHPFALPTQIPGFRTSHFDMSYRPWTRNTRGFAGFQGVEVWNVPLGLANLVSRPQGKTGEALAFAAAEKQARQTRRKITVVGGSDNHSSLLLPTTWVFAKDASEESILEALKKGATCVGGPQAGTLRARGDLDPQERWAVIGESVQAKSRVQLRFQGRARVFVDGEDQGEHLDFFLHEADENPHTYRIVIGESRSGFLYANFE